MTGPGIARGAAGENTSAIFSRQNAGDGAGLAIVGTAAPPMQAASLNSESRVKNAAGHEIHVTAAVERKAEVTE